uniref:Fibronectin type-III domain-containing protein n=1 Tax=Eptatretus burgeri TaxID=7764 RepID=A0A8C4N509_EPTBU
MYNISVFTISGNLDSQDSTTTTGQTVPATVHGLSCTPNKVNNLTTINVRWEPAEGDSTLYNITYMAKYYIDTKWDTTSNEDMMIYNLTPGRIYSIIVFTISSDLKSQNPAITTCQTVPATVHGLNCTPNKDNRTTVLDVFWEPVDGDCTGYHILCQASNTDDDSYSGDSYNHHFTCRELTPGRMYNVSVFTISGDFSSRSTFSFGQTEPANVPSVNVAGYGKRAVVVKWDPARGDKDAYFVDLYAEDKLIHSVNTSVIDNVLDDAEVIIDHLNFDFQYDAIVKTHSHALNSTGTCSSGHSLYLLHNFKP